MEIWQILLLFLVGVFSGWINTLAGGGSLLSVPALMFMDMPAPVANGTNRIAILAQSLTSVTTFLKRGHSDFRLSLTLAIAASTGAAAGASLGVRFDGVWFDRTLAVVMVAVMLAMMLGKDHPAPSVGKPQAKNLVAGHLLMVGAGFWGGLIQVGVGFLLMPVLHRVMGLNLVQVNMHKVFIVLIYTSVALAIFASQLELMWVASIGLVAGNSLGGWLGVHTTISKGELWIKRVFYVVLSAFIIKLLLF